MQFTPYRTYDIPLACHKEEFTNIFRANLYVMYDKNTELINQAFKALWSASRTNKPYQSPPLSLFFLLSTLKRPNSTLSEVYGTISLTTSLISLYVTSDQNLP